MRTIDQYDFAGKKALVRVDFNVPLDENFHITDDNRIRAAVPTIRKILNDGGAVILRLTIDDDDLVRRTGLSHDGGERLADPACAVPHRQNHRDGRHSRPPKGRMITASRPPGDGLGQNIRRCSVRDAGT